MRSPSALHTWFRDSRVGRTATGCAHEFVAYRVISDAMARTILRRLRAIVGAKTTAATPMPPAITLHGPRSGPGSRSANEPSGTVRTWRQGRQFFSIAVVLV